MWYRRYLRDLFGSLWGVAFLVAGFISTAMTFVAVYVPQFHLPRWILIGIAVAAFLLAPLRLYRKQAQRIAELESRLEQPRRALLVVKPEPDGFYIRMVNDRSRRQITGLYVEPHVTIENKGIRTATIESYDVRFPEVPQIQALERAKPNHVTQVQGVNATHMVGNGNDYVRGYVEVGGERLIGPLRIPFVIYSELPESLFPLNCELTVHDTESNTASALLLLNQRG